MRKIRVLLKEQTRNAESFRALPGAKILILCSDYELRRGMIERFGHAAVLSENGLFIKSINEKRLCSWLRKF